MPFQVSPGVNVSEIDLTTVVPAVSTTEGALAGVFRWGPVGERRLIDSESTLTATFGKPTVFNAETFFTGANFLSYGNKLYVVRTANTTSTDLTILTRNAVANTDAITTFGNTEASAAAYVVKNRDHYDTRLTSIQAGDADIAYIARYPGFLGNSLKISVCDSAAAYQSTANLDNGGGALSSNSALANVAISVGSNTATVTIAVGSGTIANVTAYANTVKSTINVGDYVQFGNSTIGTQYLKVSAVGAVTNTSSIAQFTISTEDLYNLSVAHSGTTVARYWEYWNAVDKAPGISLYQSQFGGASNTIVDELHAVVVDKSGYFTGVPGSILEVFNNMSRSTDAKTEDGASNYYKNIINDNSEYVWYVRDRSGAASTTAFSLAASTTTAPQSLTFQNGTDGLEENSVAIATLLTGYDMFASAEDIDVSLILAGCGGGANTSGGRNGTNGEQVANYLIDNIAEKRKDCVVFVSPQKADVVSNAGNESTDVVTFRNSLRSSSYAVLDSGYKYQYDKYNDLYRWIPLNGDTAGLCVRTDDTRDPWWSPAGFNRGQVKNIIKLAFNPTKAHRDILYKAGVNPVVTFPGQGTVLYGDKTLLAKPSSFDRINVRRLFIVLEKAIATATKFTLFEFNDDFTRAQFRNLVEPFLRDVQGRRGIYDFKVVCDTTNNTGEVIDRNEFIGDIYIKPAKSINYIQLNFVAVRTGVEFSEVVGSF